MLIILLSLLVFDALWIMLNLNRYKEMILKIQGKALQINVFGVVIAYIFIYILLVLSIKLHINKKSSIMDCVKYCGIIGLCVYGIYNFTNYALYKNFSISIAIADTIWGGVLFTLVAMIYKWF